MLSVIIPTHNRRKILLKCLEALFNQDLDQSKYEIIVVDDGSTDSTKKTVENLNNKQKILITYLYQAKAGQGNARNKGMEKAQGEIIVFIGDDIIVDKNFLSEHLKIHKNFPDKNHAVLGFIDWHPEIKITPFMKWLTNGSCILGKYGGHQFAYEKLKNKNIADYNFFYTSNISIKKSLLRKEKFDKTFSQYGWEDIELGYRLTKKENLVLHYNQNAIAYHNHEINEKSLKDRMIAIGQSAYIIQQKYPELNKIPSLKKQIIFWLISNLISLAIFKFISIIIPIQKTKDYYYYALSKKYFLQGLKNQI